MPNFKVRVDLDERFGPEDVLSDLRTDPSHPLHALSPSIATAPWGGAGIAFTIAAADLWTAILMTMALVRGSGYVPVAVQANTSTRG